MFIGCSELNYLDLAVSPGSLLSASCVGSIGLESIVMVVDLEDEFDF